MSGFTVCCGFWESDKFTAAASVLWPGDLYYRASGEGTIENNLNSFTVENLYNFFYSFMSFYSLSNPAPGIPAASDQGDCGEAHRHWSFGNLLQDLPRTLQWGVHNL